MGAHGRLDLPREKLGENAPTFSPSADQNANQTIARESTLFQANKTENKTALDLRFGTRQEDRDPSWVALSG